MTSYGAKLAPTARKKGPALLAGLAGMLLLTAGCGGSSSPTAAAAGAAGVPTVAGVPCQTTEKVTYHVHAHLAIYGPSGQPVPVPYGIGIGQPWQTQQSPEGPFVTSGSCFSWLHTHTGDGIIHVEAPGPQAFTLGQFFQLWGQPVGPDQAASAKGPVTAYVNGARVSGNPADIVLSAHEVIQLDVGSNVPPQPFTFPAGD